MTKRLPPISFRSAEIDAELARRYANRNQGAKQDLLDYYGWVSDMLNWHPQKLIGAQWIYREWLKGDWNLDATPQTQAYAVACARLREAHPGVDPFALTAADYEAAGFRILG